MLRSERADMSWFDLVSAHCAVRWDELSPGSRRNLVRDLSDVTIALLPAQRGRPPRATLGKALRIAFHPKASADELDEVRDTIVWAKRHGGTVRDLEDVDAFRRLMVALDKKEDGTRAAPDTIRLRRAALLGAIGYAIEKDLLVLQRQSGMFDALSLVVAVAGSGLVESAPVGPVIGVRCGVC